MKLLIKLFIVVFMISIFSCRDTKKEEEAETQAAIEKIEAVEAEVEKSMENVAAKAEEVEEAIKELDSI